MLAATILLVQHVPQRIGDFTLMEIATTHARLEPLLREPIALIVS